MSTSDLKKDEPSSILHQMSFFSPEGREEVLWVEHEYANAYRVLNAPVWVYGVSIGTVVEGMRTKAPYLRFVRVLRESPGGTVRFIVPDGSVASEVYLNRVLPDANKRGLGVGPATFFDPPIVAMHIGQRARWWPDVGRYLNALVEEGMLEQWEVGDPDAHADSAEPPEPADMSTSVLVHPLPVDGTTGQKVS